MPVICEQKQKARKTHVCYWCGEQIEKGVEYASWIWKDCGDFQKLKCHVECEEAWHKAATEEGDPYYECGPGEHCRGCMCERGRCECKQEADDDKR